MNFTNNITVDSYNTMLHNVSSFNELDFITNTLIDRIFFICSIYFIMQIYFYFKKIELGFPTTFLISRNSVKNLDFFISLHTLFTTIIYVLLINLKIHLGSNIFPYLILLLIVMCLGMIVSIKGMYPKLEDILDKLIEENKND